MNYKVSMVQTVYISHEVCVDADSEEEACAAAKDWMDDREAYSDGSDHLLDGSTVLDWNYESQVVDVDPEDVTPDVPNVTYL